MKKLRALIVAAVLTVSVAGPGLAPAPAQACMGDVCDGICITWETLGRQPILSKWFGHGCPLR